MSFRQLIVRKTEKLAIKNGNIKVVKEDGDIKIPIEDISIIVIENNKTVLTAHFLSECCKYNIAIITCDEKNLPIAITTSFHRHYRQLHIVYKQLEIGKVRKEKVWKQLVQQKILNQKTVISYTSKDTEVIKKMEEYIVSVKRNDETNREAMAAKLFFKSLYSDGFTRFANDGYNNALNYGYSVLSSSIIKELVSYGIDTKFGIWHDSKSNNFNLAYDLVEPYRALVDYYVYEMKMYITDNLSIKVRRDLVSILNAKVHISGGLYTVQDSISIVVKSYLQILEGKSELLELPQIVEVKFYLDE